MSFSKWIGSSAVRAAASAVIVLGCAGQAHAKTYSGTWDPLFGAPFSNLGWKGTADFYIPDSCEALTGWIANANACSGGAMTVSNVQLTFYNWTTLAVAQTFSLTPPEAPIYKMYWDGGIKGVSSGFYSPATPSNVDSMALAGGGAYSFHMLFNEVADPVGSPSVQLFYTATGNNPLCIFGYPSACAGGYGYSATMATLTVVPEPEAYALALSSLVVLGVFARRRRR